MDSFLVVIRSVFGFPLTHGSVYGTADDELCFHRSCYFVPILLAD